MHGLQRVEQLSSDSEHAHSESVQVGGYDVVPAYEDATR